MFALEIIFPDGVTPSAMEFLRRPQALIGPPGFAKVEIEDMKALGYQVRLIRGSGRTFICKVSPVGGGEANTDLEGTYTGYALLDTGPVRISVTALDLDLLVKESEPSDKAGVRIMRRACSVPAAEFPAVMVRGAPPMVVSFSPDQPLLIGRSRACGLRLDSADISGKHARLGYENGQFWIEDLGSTNGTYVEEQQISGRVNFSSGARVVLGREVSITGVLGPEELSERQEDTEPVPPARTPAPDVNFRYPVLYSVSPVARPAKLIIGPGSSVALGRDPECEMWLGAPHVSRRHCMVTFSKEGVLTIADTSTNGTAWNGGIISRGEEVEVGENPGVLDFGSGVTVAVCFTDEEERKFAEAGGAAWAFSGSVAQTVLAGAEEMAAMSGRQSRASERESEQAAGRGGFFAGLSGIEKGIVIVFVVALVLIAGVIARLLAPLVS